MSGDEIVEQILWELDDEITDRILNNNEYSIEVARILTKVHDRIIELKKNNS